MDDDTDKSTQSVHLREIHAALKKSLAARPGPLWDTEAMLFKSEDEFFERYDPFAEGAPLMPCAETMDSLCEFVHSSIAYRRSADKAAYAGCAAVVGDHDPTGSARALPTAQVAATVTRKGKVPTGATAKAAVAPASLDDDAGGGHAVAAPASKAGSPRVTKGFEGRAAAAPPAAAAPAAAAAAAAAAVAAAPAAGSKRRRAEPKNAVDLEDDRDGAAASASGSAQSSKKAQKKRNDRA